MDFELESGLCTNRSKTMNGCINVIFDGEM